MRRVLELRWRERGVRWVDGLKMVVEGWRWWNGLDDGQQASTVGPGVAQVSYKEKPLTIRDSLYGGIDWFWIEV